MKRSGVLLMLAAVIVVLVIGSAASVAALQVGERAPEFTLPATTAEKYSLNQFQGKKHVVLFGFIGAFTPTWTREVAAFQLDLPQIESRNAQVVGISSDFPMTNTAWSEKLGLTFPLVSDFPRKTLEAYGIMDTDPNSLLYRYAKRAYLIIDKTGVLRYKKILDNPRELVSNDELLAELDKLK